MRPVGKRTITRGKPGDTKRTRRKYDCTNSGIAGEQNGRTDGRTDGNSSLGLLIEASVISKSLDDNGKKCCWSQVLLLPLKAIGFFCAAFRFSSGICNRWPPTSTRSSAKMAREICDSRSGNTTADAKSSASTDALIISRSSITLRKMILFELVTSILSSKISVRKAVGIRAGKRSPPTFHFPLLLLRSGHLFSLAIGWNSSTTSRNRFVIWRSRAAPYLIRLQLLEEIIGLRRIN